ncbi:ABC transporter permease [Polycladidibacter stylochi]|uniref:ABC transporter permease n=1 Tax=Polycladidibacter stylochi TaxID=1807766 RepID=UPI00082B684F|nr:ABC transporter permease [Pseudovibrio stylochi]
MSKQSRATHNSMSFTLALHLALRELRVGLKGFYIFIACIALGVAAISGVASVSKTLTQSITTQARQILGGDIAISQIHRPVSLEQKAAFAKLGQLSSITTLRAMARSTHDQQQTLVEIKAIDHAYPLNGSLKLKTNTNKAQTLNQTAASIFPAFADPELLARLNISIGDQIEVGRTKLEIVDEITQEPDKLGSGMTLGPRLMIGQQALAATGLIQPGSLATYQYRIKLEPEPDSEQLKQTINHLETQYPDAGWRIRSRMQAAPSLQANISRFAQFLSLVGITSLIVGGVGVANAVRSYLATRRSTIATFKCLGASGALVFQIYLIQVMILATLGVVLGTLIGALAPLVITELLQSRLPITLSYAIYPGELLSGIAYGYLTALAFALLPLGRAHDVSPSLLFREDTSSKKKQPKLRYYIATAGTLALLLAFAIALSYDQRVTIFFILACAATFILLLLIAKLIMALARRMPHIASCEWRLAITNMHRPGALTPSVVMSLGLGLTLLVALALTDSNLRATLTRTANEQAPSFFLLDIQHNEIDNLSRFIQTKAPQAQLETVPMLRGRILSLAGIPASQITPPPEAAWVLRSDRGITYSSQLPENSKLISGSWWPDNYTGKPLVSFDFELGQALGLKIGDSISVNVLGRTITANIANFRQVEWESLGINFVMVFSPNTFAGAPHTMLTTIKWPNKATTQDELALLSALTTKYPTITAIRVKDAITQVNSLIAQLAWAIRGASAITLLASVLVLAGALAAGHQSRIHDAVLLKTLGATRGRIMKAYIIEYALLGTTTAIFAIIAGCISAYYVIAEIMGGSFSFYPLTAVSAILIAIGLTIGFGLLGTWRILGERPGAVLREL